MKNLTQKITNLILKLISQLESDISRDGASLKDKKIMIDSIAKLMPMILRIQKIETQKDASKVGENDLKIINDFLEKNQKTKLVAREGFEPPTNGL